MKVVLAVLLGATLFSRTACVDHHPSHGPRGAKQLTHKTKIATTRRRSRPVNQTEAGRRSRAAERTKPARLAGIDDSLVRDALRRDVARLSVKLPREGVPVCQSEVGNDWHYMAGPATEALAAHGLGVPGGHAYEFGVYAGGSVRSLFDALDPPFLWGLDSFQGLPNYRDERVAGWRPGQYRADPRAQLTKEFGADRVGFVPGLYASSLTPSLAQDRGMRPAAYLGVDCDLYVSTGRAP